MNEALIRRADGTLFSSRILFRDGHRVVTAFGTFVRGRWVVHGGFHIVAFTVPLMHPETRRGGERWS